MMLLGVLAALVCWLVVVAVVLSACVLAGWVDEDGQ